MLTARTAKGEHERREATLQVALHMGIGQPIDALKESGYLAIVLQESDDGFIQSCQLLIGLVAARVVR